MHALLVNRLFKLAQEKGVVRLTDHPAMTMAVDLERKATKQTNKQTNLMAYSQKPPINAHADISSRARG